MQKVATKGTVERAAFAPKVGLLRYEGVQSSQSAVVGSMAAGVEMSAQGQHGWDLNDVVFDCVMIASELNARCSCHTSVQGPRHCAAGLSTSHLS